MGELTNNSSFEGIHEILTTGDEKNNCTIQFMLEDNIKDKAAAKKCCEIALHNMINIFSWHTDGQVGLPIQGKIRFSGETSDSANLHGLVAVLIKKKNEIELKKILKIAMVQMPIWIYIGLPFSMKIGFQSF